MDEMRISSNFTKGIISKIVGKVINEKLGVNTSIGFASPIELTIDDNSARIHLDLSVSVPKEDLLKLIKDLV